MKRILTAIRWLERILDKPVSWGDMLLLAAVADILIPILGR